jgi:hypothetical protein
MITGEKIHVTAENEKTWVDALNILTSNRAYFAEQLQTGMLEISVLDDKAKAFEYINETMREITKDVPAKHPGVARRHSGWFSRFLCKVLGHKGSARVCPRCWMKVEVVG